MIASKMKPNSNPIVIHESNLPTGIVFKNKQVIYNISYWHKFIINNAENIPRNEVLRAILDHVHPLDLIPVSFGKEQSYFYFLARNCGAAVEKLCKDNLTVPSSDRAHPFKLKIILKFATTAEFKIDVQKNIISVLNKRYNSARKTINLSKIHEDADLIEFCPMSQPKIMFFILHLSKNLIPLPERYILSDNRIKILNPLEALSGLNITFLDLSNNLIDDITEIAPIKSLKITELILDGNPLCDKLDEPAYLENVNFCCPKLEKLDGVTIKEGNLPPIKTNFLCNVDAVDLVNQFLEYYFTIYDSRNRQVLEDVYHKNAMFSLTSSYISGQMSSTTSLLRPYNNCSRNLMKLADFSRNSEFLFRSNFQIVKMLCSLPSTEHDPYSFKVDLIHYTPYCAVICVGGVFRELPENLLDPEKMFGFTRTFALEIINGDGVCCIVNEQFHVYNALSSQMVNAFKIAKPTRIDVMPIPQTEKDQQQVADTLKIITNLNSDWSKKCLEECNYDLKRALALFVDLYKVDKIPTEAFLNNKSLF